MNEPPACSDLQEAALMGGTSLGGAVSGNLGPGEKQDVLKGLTFTVNKIRIAIFH